jgi:hypothetical protein
MHVVVVGDGLVVHRESPGLLPIPLIPLGNGDFGSAGDPSLRISFDRAADGRVIGAKVLQGGRTYQGPRRP